ncbi:hypothetical protein ACH5RR_032648 [Cinchona calisaya]|uniref:Disease resistance N-terminal domain-containing protein n=1 Tax=Cinchona calisaya TaxID=153742 RepID=A0ABD2YKQ1_9GENT
MDCVFSLQYVKFYGKSREEALNTDIVFSVSGKHNRRPYMNWTPVKGKSTVELSMRMDLRFDNCFHLALLELQNQLDNYLEEEEEEVELSGLSKFLVVSLSRNIDILIRDWRFLRMLWECIQDQNDSVAATDKLFLQQQKNLEQEEEGVSLSFVLLAIEAAAEEIGRDLIRHSEIKNQKKKSKFSELKLLESVVVDCQRKTDQLIAKFGEAVDQDCYMSGRSFQVHSPPPPLDHFVSFWTSFVDSVMSNLWSIKSSMYLFDDIDKKRASASFKEIELIQDYVLQVIHGGQADILTLITTHDFLTHVASVIVRVANQACSYWLNYKTGRIQVAKSKLTKLVEDLHREIDPTNPKFIDVHLNFLRDLYKVYGVTFSVAFFCDYLHTWRANIYLEQELSSLLVDVFNTKLVEEEEEEEESRWNVQSLFAETNAVLVEAFTLWEVLRKQDETDPPPCFELLTKICLLKAELFLKGLLCNINNTSSFSQCILFDKNHVQGLNAILANLTRYSEGIPHEKIEFKKKSFALVKELVKEVAFLSESFEAKKISESTVKNSLFQLLLKFVLFKAESVLMELILSKSNNATLMAHGKDQIILLLEQLKCFTLIFPNQQMKDRVDVDMIFVQIEAFTMGVTRFSRSFLPRKITEAMINEMNLSSSQLLDKVKHIKPKLKEIAPPFPVSSVPKTYKLGFLDFLIRNIGGLLKHDADSVASVKHHVEEIQLHLRSLRPILEKISELDVQHQELKDLGNHIIELAYKVEYVIDSIEIDAYWQHFFWFYNLLEELRLVAKQAFRIHVSIEDAKDQKIMVSNFILTIT